MKLSSTCLLLGTASLASAACKSDFDCSLAGTCTAGACVCQPWTKGPDCAALNLKPIASPQALQSIVANATQEKWTNVTSFCKPPHVGSAPVAGD